MCWKNINSDNTRTWKRWPDFCKLQRTFCPTDWLVFWFHSHLLSLGMWTMVVRATVDRPENAPQTAELRVHAWSKQTVMFLYNTTQRISDSHWRLSSSQREDSTSNVKSHTWNDWLLQWSCGDNNGLEFQCESTRVVELLLRLMANEAKQGHFFVPSTASKSQWQVGSTRVQTPQRVVHYALS